MAGILDLLAQPPVPQIDYSPPGVPPRNPAPGLLAAMIASAPSGEASLSRPNQPYLLSGGGGQPDLIYTEPAKQTTAPAGTRTISDLIRGTQASGYGTPPEGMVLNPRTGQMEDLRSPVHKGIPQGRANAAALGIGQGLSFNLFDETVAAAAHLLGGDYSYDVARMREAERRAAEEYPVTYYGGNVVGAIGTGVAAAPATVLARAAGSPLLQRVGAGTIDGLIAGSLHGAGSGTDAESRLKQGAIGAGTGALVGGAFPLVAAGASRGYETARNLLSGRQIAPQVGSSPEALRMLGNAVDADGARGRVGAANMARAGEDAMLAGAGPNARPILDTAIQRGGRLLPGEGRVGTYRDLDRARLPDDNITPHHMPSAYQMRKSGVARNDGVSIMVEQPTPGTGGRHRRTRTYGRRIDNESVRDALARDIVDLRRIYQEDGLWSFALRQRLQEVIDLNKSLHSKIFRR